MGPAEESDRQRKAGTVVICLNISTLSPDPYCMASVVKLLAADDIPYHRREAVASLRRSFPSPLMSSEALA